MAVRQLEDGRAEVENQYGDAVTAKAIARERDPHLRGLRDRRPALARRRNDSDVGLQASLRVPGS